MERVVLFGNGEMASQIYFYLTHDSPFDVAGFTVDGDHLEGDTLFGLPVVPFAEVEHRFPPDDFRMSVPVSYRQVNQLRAAKYHEAKSMGYQLINYIGSKAMTWPGLITGDNCIILEGCVVQPFSRLGNNVIMGCGSHLGHNSVIGDHCFLGPNAVVLGHVQVEPFCFIGANATIRDGLTIARESVVGAGVTLRRNTLPKQVYITPDGDPLGKPSDQLRNWLTWAR